MLVVRTVGIKLRTLVLGAVIALVAVGSVGLAQQASADGGNTLTFTTPATTTHTITFSAPPSGQIALAPPDTGPGTLTLLAPEPNTGNGTLAVVTPSGVAAAADTGSSPSGPGTTGN